jgi:tRNA pseudouridine55 synthase
MTPAMILATRKPRRAIHGILLLDKPRGISSNAALQQVKRLYCAEKAGHTGNLDPLATGMLPICLGEATKISAYLLDADKQYRTRCLLGVETDSADSEGRITVTHPVPSVLDRGTIETVLASFRGEIDQIPPMYSALKHQGQPLYKLARQGMQIERASRRVTIHRLELKAVELPHLELDVECSKGTYIRSLVEDLGRALGCGAHVVELRRLASMPFTGPMYELPRLEEMARTGGQNTLDSLLLPADRALPDWPELVLDPAGAALLRQGQAIRVDGSPTLGLLRLYAKQDAGQEREFIGVGRVLEDGRIGPKRLIFSQK